MQAVEDLGVGNGVKVRSQPASSGRTGRYETDLRFQCIDDRARVGINDCYVLSAAIQPSQEHEADKGLCRI